MVRCSVQELTNALAVSKMLKYLTGKILFDKRAVFLRTHPHVRIHPHVHIRP